MVKAYDSRPIIGRPMGVWEITRVQTRLSPVVSNGMQHFQTFGMMGSGIFLKLGPKLRLTFKPISLLFHLCDRKDTYNWCVRDINRMTYQTGEIYQLIKDHEPKVTWNREVWHFTGIPRHQFLAWLFVLNRCPTKDRLLHWGILVDPMCLLCKHQHESMNHLFFDCSYSWVLWAGLLGRCSVAPIRSWDLVLQFLNSLPAKNTKRYMLLLVWQSAIYQIWSERNHRLHWNVEKPVQCLQKQIDLSFRNRASLRDARPRLASNLLQAWFSGNLSPSI